VHGGKTERTDNPLDPIHISDNIWMGKNVASLLTRKQKIDVS